ncbi:MAG TPA: hypothetical protein VKO62_08590 [Solirubrobacterales bacterium]|nr:hypothetical protein [Solirubrobacterales bacterium]
MSGVELTTAPEVVKTEGCYRTDPFFPGRREVKRLTGNYKMPTLVLDKRHDHRWLLEHRRVGAQQRGP